MSRSLLILFTALTFFRSAQAAKVEFPFAPELRASTMTSMDDLLNLADGTRSVEDLLARLPAPLLHNYSLILESRSRQGATRLNPRVNLFDPSGFFYLAFTGHPQAAGAQQIEVLTFDPLRARWQFDGLDYSDGYPRRFSAQETARCLNCHSTDQTLATAHAIWDSYPDWPDRYGATDSLGSGHLPTSPILLDGLREIMAHAHEHPRLQYLGNLDQMTMRQLGLMNSIMGDKILDAQFRKATRLIVEAPDFARTRAAWRALTEKNAPAFEMNLSSADNANFRARRHALQREIEKSLNEYYASKRDRYMRIAELSELAVLDASRIDARQKFMARYDDRYLDELVRYRFLLERLKLPADLLNLTFERGTNAFVQGAVSLFDLPRLVEVEARSCAKFLLAP